jgi:acetylornithine deacetylase/succinyl-diaminopimelate desuccinylase-like protein
MTVRRDNLTPVYQYIDQHAEEATALLSRLTRQPSISATGEGLQEMAELCVEVLDERGYSARLLPGHGGPPAVFAESERIDAPTVFVYAHYDVQPVDPLDLWESPPFEPTFRDGKLYARGVWDDKGDIAVRLVALEALRAVTGRLPVNVKFFIEGEEESTSPHLPAVFEENGALMMCDVAFLESAGLHRNGRPQIFLGCKGVLYVELEARGPSRDAHSSLAAVVQNPAWRLLWALASLKGPDGRIRIPGFYDAVRPWKDSELECLKTMPQDDAALREMLELEELLGGVTGFEALKQLAGVPTCNICGFHCGYGGGGVKTVLPAVARAMLDFLLVPEQRTEDIAEKLRVHLRREGFGDIKVDVLGDSMQPFRGDADNSWLKLVVETAREFYGAEPIIAPNVGGSIGWSTFADTLQVPVFVAPGGAGYWGSNIHSPNEHIRVSDYLESCKFTASLFDVLGTKVSEK